MTAFYQPGIYECIVQSQGFGESKEKKTPYFFLAFSPVKHNGREVESPYERELKMWLTDKTVERAIGQLRGLGWGGSSFADLEPGGHSFRGVNLTLTCTHNADGYEDWELPAPSSGTSQQTPGVTKRLDALFGRELKNGAGTAPVRPQASSPSAPVEVVPDGDVPF